MSGTGDCETRVAIADAAAMSGMATRTSAAPAVASDRICPRVASTSSVRELVIDWTTTGAPPPTGTPPTFTCSRLPT